MLLSSPTSCYCVVYKYDDIPYTLEVFVGEIKHSSTHTLTLLIFMFMVHVSLVRRPSVGSEHARLGACEINRKYNHMQVMLMAILSQSHPCMLTGTYTKVTKKHAINRSICTQTT